MKEETQRGIPFLISYWVSDNKIGLKIVVPLITVLGGNAAGDPWSEMITLPWHTPKKPSFQLCLHKTKGHPLTNGVQGITSNFGHLFVYFSTVAFMFWLDMHSGLYPSFLRHLYEI